MILRPRKFIYLPKTLNYNFYNELNNKNYDFAAKEIYLFAQDEKLPTEEVYPFPPQDIEDLIAELTKDYISDERFTSNFIERLRESLSNYSTTDRELTDGWGTYYADKQDDLRRYLKAQVQGYFKYGGRGVRDYPEFMQNKN